MSYAQSFLLLTALLAMSVESKAQGIVYQPCPPIRCFPQYQIIQEGCCPEPCCGSSFAQMPFQATQGQCSPCQGLVSNDCCGNVVQTGYKSMQSPCDDVSIGFRGVTGGTIEDIQFPAPMIRQIGDHLVADVSRFDVTVTNLRGVPSEYVLVTGVVKTSGADLKSEVQLQVDTLIARNGTVRITPKRVEDVDEDGTFRFFVTLFHTTTHETVEQKNSIVWRIKTLEQSEPESKLHPTPRVVIHLPY